MKYDRINNTLSIAKDIINHIIKEGNIAIDATIGNGYDTVDLARLVGVRGKVYGFDIQKIAIENTKKLLKQNNLLKDNVILINDSHENIDKYIKEPVDLVIYNLGYLPKGDKNIITSPKSTVISVSKSLELLKENGIIIIVSYIGHRGGLEEKNVLEERLKHLDQRKFNVLKSKFINQKNFPPILYVIEKARF